MVPWSAELATTAVVLGVESTAVQSPADSASVLAIVLEGTPGGPSAAVVAVEVCTVLNASHGEQFEGQQKHSGSCQKVGVLGSIVVVPK